MFAMPGPGFRPFMPSVRARSAVVAALVLGITTSALVTPASAAESTTVAPPTAPAPAPPAPPAIEPLAPLPPETMSPPPASDIAAPPTATAPAPPPVVLNAAPPPATPQDVDRPIFERWWFWTAIAAFAVTAVIIVATSSGPNTPKTDLGNMPAF
jgi:hypothetical protein